MRVADSSGITKYNLGFGQHGGPTFCTKTGGQQQTRPMSFSGNKMNQVNLSVALVERRCSSRGACIVNTCFHVDVHQCKASPFDGIFANTQRICSKHSRRLHDHVDRQNLRTVHGMLRFPTTKKRSGFNPGFKVHLRTPTEGFDSFCKVHTNKPWFPWFPNRTNRTIPTMGFKVRHGFRNHSQMAMATCFFFCKPVAGSSPQSGR